MKAAALVTRSGVTGLTPDGLAAKCAGRPGWPHHRCERLGSKIGRRLQEHLAQRARVLARVTPDDVGDAFLNVSSRAIFHNHSPGSTTWHSQRPWYGGGGGPPQPLS